MGDYLLERFSERNNHNLAAETMIFQISAYFDFLCWTIFLLLQSACGWVVAAVVILKVLYVNKSLIVRYIIDSKRFIHIIVVPTGIDQFFSSLQLSLYFFPAKNKNITLRFFM